jgi:hypothetical protein
MKMIREDEGFFDAFSKVELEYIGDRTGQRGRGDSGGKAFKLSILMKREGETGD